MTNSKKNALSSRNNLISFAFQLPFVIVIVSSTFGIGIVDVVKPKIVFLVRLSFVLWGISQIILTLIFSSTNLVSNTLLKI